MSREKITREQFYDKYGDCEVELDSYYKFTFDFKGNSDGKEILVHVGGASDEIYKDDWRVGVTYTVKEIEPYSGTCGDDSFYDFH